MSTFPLLNKACKDSKFHCVTCELSKHIRTSYIPHMTWAPSAFDLIYFDVQGPSPISAFSGYRYYVTFIDNHTRCTWVYLLHHKSDVFSIFVQFCKWLRHNFIQLLGTSALIMVGNTSPMSFVLTLIERVFFNNLHVLGPLNKMVWLNVKTVILCLSCVVFFVV